MKPSPRLFPLALTLVLHGTVSIAASPAAGIDLTGFDSSVRAQDDLFESVNGGWRKRTEIPADKPQYGSFIRLRDISDERVRNIVDELARQKHDAGSVAQKVGDFYASFLDTEAIDKAGMAPVEPLLAEIDAIGTFAELAQWQGRTQGLVNAPVALWVGADRKQPTMNRAITWQGGLGLPDRDYYLKTDDTRKVKARAAYEVYLTTLAAQAGEVEPARAALRVMAIEQRIAEAH